MTAARVRVLWALGLAALLASHEPALALWPAGWTSGALFGADVRSIAFDPVSADTVFSGTASGQVYVSRDGGQRWAAAGVALPFPGWVVASLKFDPNRPQQLWAAMWGIFGGGLLVRSEDGGSSWTTVQQFRSQVYALALVPGTPGRLYLGTREGVERSDDDGRHWTRASRGTPSLVHVSSLWVDPSRPRTVLAGTWRRAYRSDDGGDSWRGVFGGMVEDSQVFSLHSPMGDPRRIWASTCGWVYSSEDGGTSWTRFRDGLDERRTPSFAVLLDGELLAGTVAGAYASVDGGRTWARRTASDLSILAIAQDPRRPQRVLLGTEGSGVWLSEDGGRTFRKAAEGLTNVRVAATLWFRGGLLAAVNHAGPASGLYLSRDGGATFPEGPEPLPTVLAMARLGDRVLVGTEKGLFAGVPGAWKAVPQLGAARVEQLAVDGETWMARTASGLFTGDGRSTSRLTADAASSVALWRGELLSMSGAGMRRHGARGAAAVATPEKKLQLQAIEEGLIAVSPAGVLWLREQPGGAWREVATGVRRALPTGNPQAPMLLLTAEGAFLAERGLRRFKPVELPVPAQDVLSAQSTPEGLLLGTSGYGVLLYREELAAAALEPARPARP